jgi:hypothetical protein
MPSSDNPSIRGPLDSQWVALTQAHEVRTFIDNWIKTWEYADTPAIRDSLATIIKAYPGRKPVSRTDLETYLDAKLAIAGC